MLVQRALDGVHGVDLNPFAVAIARFRLLLAALKECGITRLGDAPGFAHQPRLRRLAAARQRRVAISRVDARLTSSIDHVYQPEDLRSCERLLGRGSTTPWSPTRRTSRRRTRR